MIRIATCGHIQFEKGSVVDALNAFLRGHGEIEYEINELGTPVELIDSVSAALTEVPYDLIVCALDLVGVSGVHTISELNELHSFADDLRMVLCTVDAEYAFSAQQSGANGFLLEPISQADFDRVIGRQLIEIAARNEESVVVRCRDRARRIFFNRLSYVETSGHDQLLHHIGRDSVCGLRGSSRDVFALLEADDRFFKVGSSYIVNLDHVESFDSKHGFAKLSDGVEIPVPVRLRKPLEQALINRGHVVA